VTVKIHCQHQKPPVVRDESETELNLLLLVVKGVGSGGKWVALELNFSFENRKISLSLNRFHKRETL